jgi:hypothetical protein
MSMILEQADADAIIYDRLATRTHWCIIPTIEFNYIAERVESEYYDADKSKGFEAMIYPINGGVQCLYFADKSMMDADQFYRLCRDEGSHIPRELFDDRDIMFLTGTDDPAGEGLLVAMEQVLRSIAKNQWPEVIQ